MALCSGDAPAGHPSELPVLRGLTPAQRAAVVAPDPTLCVVAGAGSGKTRVLTRRVAYRALTGDAAPEHVVVVTFTRKAAGELRRRLWQLDVDGVTVGTFHGLAYAELRRHWADGRRPVPGVVPDPARIVRRLVEEQRPGRAGDSGRSRAGDSGRARPGATAGDRAAAADGELARALAAEVDWAQARDLTPDRYPAAARAAERRPLVPVDDVAEIFQRYLEEKRRRHVVDLHDLVAGAARLLESDPAVAEAVRWRARHFFVDEFQDVNPAQWRLLRALLGGRRDLFVVGDPQQAIYSWNGADPTLMARLPDLVPGTTVLRLDDNHRCTPQVVAVATAVLADGRGGDGADGGATATAAAGPAAGPVGAPGSSRPDGPLPEVRAFDDEDAEAVAVVRWLRLVHQPGARWANLAVLARTHARLAAVAEALGRAGIPCHYGPPHDGRPAPAADTGDEPGDADAPPTTLDRTAPADRPTASDPAPGPGGDEDRRDAVELATFHRAKGLEWDAVALVGLEEGMVPIAYARSAEAVAEERRLLYVAVTRASRQLWCSWARQRRVAGRLRPAGPSPWLAAVGAAAVPPPVAPALVARQHLRLLRQQLAEPS